MTMGIYKIENRQDGKAYIGSSANIERRWVVHRSMLRRGKHHCIHLQRAWDKYGEGAFAFRIAEIVEDPCLCLTAEQGWLDEHFTQGNCYNIAREASAPMRGRTHTDETRRKMSAALTGKLHPLWGKHLTEETRRKLSKAMMGKQNTLGHQTFLGHKHTKETKRRMSESAKRRWARERAENLWGLGIGGGTQLPLPLEDYS